jgi:cytochrome c oxidase cbb3-type subunit III
MAELPSDFWSGWVIVLTLTSFAGLVWLVLSVYLLPDAADHGPEEPVWDETLREGQSPAPVWWFWFILAAMVFSVIYLMLYPGLGSYAGALRWSQGGQLEDHQQDFEREFAAVRETLLAQDVTALAVDPLAMDLAQRLFRDQCSACHGTAALGQASLFPNLRDPEWQWGGSAEQIEQTIRNGRQAMMVAWQPVLGDEGVDNVAAYVATLANGGEQGHSGQLQYQQFCFACHGMSGEGNVLLGAPALNDREWLYGGDPDSIRTSIATGRNGQMPAFGDKLDDLQIKVLVAWLLP